MKLTEWLAIYGAAISTIVFIWNILRARPKIIVDLVYGVDREHVNAGMGFYVSIKNHSSYSAHISSATLLYPYRKVSAKELLACTWRYKRIPQHLGWIHVPYAFADVKTGLPITIEPFAAHEFFVPQTTIEDTLGKTSTVREFAVEVQDALWRNRCSNRINLLVGSRSTK